MINSESHHEVNEEKITKSKYDEIRKQCEVLNCKNAYIYFVHIEKRAKNKQRNKETNKKQNKTKILLNG